MLVNSNFTKRKEFRIVKLLIIKTTSNVTNTLSHMEVLKMYQKN